MKINRLFYFLCFAVFLAIAFSIERRVRNGWLGPNASTKVEISNVVIDKYVALLKRDDIILFDDNSYHRLKSLPNKKMPITYFMMYQDVIQAITSNNLAGSRALTLVDCDVYNAVKLQNNLTAQLIESFDLGKLKLCIAAIQ
jgi:preprotein translocase subunit Sec63